MFGLKSANCYWHIYLFFPSKDQWHYLCVLLQPLTALIWLCWADDCDWTNLNWRGSVVQSWYFLTLLLQLQMVVPRCSLLIDCVTATPLSSPIISQTTCFNLETSSDWFLKHHENEPWSAHISFLRYSLLALISAVLFIVFPFTPSITWPWHVLGWQIEPQKHVNTWKIFFFFRDKSISYRFMYQTEKKRWMSAGWCCRRNCSVHH